MKYDNKGHLKQKIETRLDRKGLVSYNYQFINGVNELVLERHFPAGELLEERPPNGMEKYLEFQYDRFKNWTLKSERITDWSSQKELMYQSERQIDYY